MKNLIAILVLLTAVAFGSTTASPNTITTDLRWGNPAGSPRTVNDIYYVGTTVTVTGSTCSSGSPCTWTIKDQNGNVNSSVTTTAQKGSDSVFGNVDCTGSVANTSCVYNAPADYPCGATASIVVSDGSTTSTVSITYSNKYLLTEWFAHRCRTMQFNSKPFTVTGTGTGQSFIDNHSEHVIFRQPSTTGAGIGEMAIIESPNDINSGTSFSTMAGSAINVPAWSYDGKWFELTSSACIPSSFCSNGDSIHSAWRSDGSQRKVLTVLHTPYMWDYVNPNLVIGSDSTSFYAHNMTTDVDTDILDYTTPAGTPLNLFRPPNGSLFLSVNVNPVPGTCTPGDPCTPQVNILDLSACEVSMSSQCATVNTQFTINFTFSPNIYDAQGNPHCNVPDMSPAEDTGDNKCPYHLHDQFLRRGKGTEYWGNYGPKGTAGEPIFFRRQANGTLGAGYPNPAIDLSYCSHPAFDWQGNLLSGGCDLHCAPSGNGCVDDNTTGSLVFDFRQSKAIVFVQNQSLGHTSWEGFDSLRYLYDGFCIVGGQSHWCLNEQFANPNAVYSRMIIDFGNRPSDTNGTLNSFLFGPVQSPDATKAAEVAPTSVANSTAAPFLGWIYYTARPASPIRPRLTVTNAATIGWFAHPLNHETATYQVWKQPSCSGAWSRQARVSSVYLQATEYTYTDAGLGSGSSACYAVTSIEWEGAESDTTTKIVGVTNTAGVFSNSSNRIGEVNFDLTAPAPVTSVSSTQSNVGTPAALSISSTPGGSTLGAGKYWFRPTYVRYSDAPANLTPVETVVGPVVSITIAANATINLSSSSTDMIGQEALRVYGGFSNTTEPSLFLQTCNGLSATIKLTVPQAPASGGSAAGCDITSLASSLSPSSGTVRRGFTLAWTAPADVDVRYYAIYYRDGSAPPVNNIGHNDALRLAAQPYLIATVAAGTTSWLDYAANAATSNPHYAVVAVDSQGNYSTGVCVQANNSADTCN